MAEERLWLFPKGYVPRPLHDNKLGAINLFLDRLGDCGWVGAMHAMHIRLGL